jgi:hypothetical protein
MNSANEIEIKITTTTTIGKISSFSISILLFNQLFLFDLFIYFNATQKITNREVDSSKATNRKSKNTKAKKIEIQKQKLKKIFIFCNIEFKYWQNE